VLADEDQSDPWLKCFKDFFLRITFYHCKE
jgi:hypothetical protein